MFAYFHTVDEMDQQVEDVWCWAERETTFPLRRPKPGWWLLINQCLLRHALRSRVYVLVVGLNCFSLVYSNHPSCN